MIAKSEEVIIFIATNIRMAVSAYFKHLLIALFL